MHKRVGTGLGYTYFQFFASSRLYVQGLVLSLSTKHEIVYMRHSYSLGILNSLWLTLPSCLWLLPCDSFQEKYDFVD